MDWDGLNESTAEVAAEVGGTRRSGFLIGMMGVGIPELAGLWARGMNYEPRPVVADCASRDKSVVLWGMAPDGTYVDVRSVAGESGVRGFGGTCRVSPGPDSGALVLTWEREIDTKPDSCPSGVDASAARPLLIGRSETELEQLGSAPNLVLLEEGDGFLEVWTRIALWDDHAEVVEHRQGCVSLAVGGILLTAGLSPDDDAPFVSAVLSPDPSSSDPSSSDPSSPTPSSPAPPSPTSSLLLSALPIASTHAPSTSHA